MSVSVICAVILPKWCVLPAGGCTVLITFLCVRCRGIGVKGTSAYTITAAALFLFFYLYAANTKLHSEENFPFDNTNKNTVLLVGRVDSIKSSTYGIRLIVKDCSIYENDDEYKRITVLVNIAGNEDLEPGDIVQIRGNISRFEEAGNDGQFNEKIYYRSVGVDYKVKGSELKIVKKADDVQMFLNRLKKETDSIYENAADSRDAGVLKAVVLGDRQGLNDDIYKLYQDCGIAHLLAISSIHVSFIGVLLYKMAKRLFGGYVMPFCISIAILTLYTVMTGNGISAKRAVIMCVVCMGADVLGRTYDILTGLGIAAIILILENIWVIYNTGFLLSFGAIIGIAVIYPAFDKVFLSGLKDRIEKTDRKREAAKRKYYMALAAAAGNILCSISISLVTMPVIMYQYYKLPVYSVFLNVIAIPLMSLLLLCALLAAFTGLIVSPCAASFFVGMVHYILKFYTFLCRIFENIPGNTYVTGCPDIGGCILFYIMLGVFAAAVHFTKKPFKLSLLAVAAAVCVIIPKPHKNLTVDMADVGQGDCILVRDESASYLIDGGSSDVANVGSKRIYPLLLYNGVTRLNYVMVSHADTDHISGILELIDMAGEKLVIDNLVLPDIRKNSLLTENDNYRKLIDTAVKSGINVIYTKKGDVIDTKFVCLHPDIDYEAAGLNDASAVYMLQKQNFSMLLTGDIEEAGERELEKVLEKAAEREKNKENGFKNAYKSITVLKTAHHGSAGSSSIDFIQKISPQFALISCGANNRYGHPSKQTLDRLESAGSKVYVTAECGQITIETDGKNYRIRTKLNRNETANAKYLYSKNEVKML